MTEHKKLRRYNDECYCADCGKSWSITDTDPPACKKTAAEHIAAIREMLKKKGGE